MARRLLTQPDADFQAQDKAASEAGLSWAEWVRRALQEALKRQG